MLSVVLGVALLILVTADLLATSLHGGWGLMSRGVQLGLYRALHLLARPLGRRVLAWSPGVLLAGTVAVWVGLTWLAWLLIFVGLPGGVVDPEGETVRGLVDLLYFSGSTVSTLGVGDLQPDGVAMQLLMPLSALNGFFLLTFSITFLSPAGETHESRRALALRLALAGQTPAEVLASAGGHPQGVGGWLNERQAELLTLASRHRSAPFLHLFHDARPEQSLHRQLPLFGDALLLLQHGPNEPPANLESTRGALDALVASVPPGRAAAPELHPEECASLGALPAGEWAAALAAEQPWRERLYVLWAQGCWK